MWTFGNILVKGKVVLGPMAGITTLAYRGFMKKFGVDLFYTEMVSDCGIICDSKNTKKYLVIDKKEHPIGVQLFGGQAKTLVKAIHKLEAMNIDYDFLDINLGCPMPKVTKTGAGAAWLKRPDELEDMMRQVVAASSKPVSAKIRIGSDDQSINYSDIVRRMEDAGVCMIAIHTRTTKQIYHGPARHEVIKDLGLTMRVPLVISGDIDSIEHAQYALDVTKANAVMVARGGLGRPGFVKQLSQYFKDGTILPEATIKDQLRYLRQFAKRLMALKGEDVAMRELRGIGVHFLTGYPGMKKYKAMISQINTLNDLETILRQARRDPHVQQSK
jgi:nifR3 family TIM-barrel protein